MKNAFTVVPMLMLLTISLTHPIAAQNRQSATDRDVRVIDFEELKYPPLARAARIQGIVVVRVSLDDKGGVRDAEVVSGVDLLSRDCLANVHKWRFQPNAQKTAVVIYSFTMPGGECRSVSGLFMFKGPNLATIIGCDVPVDTTR